MPKNVKFTEEKLAVVLERPTGGALGNTTWVTMPTFSFDAFCDAQSKTWVCRVTKATGKQKQNIGTPTHPITPRRIDGAQCTELKQFENILKGMMNDPAPASEDAPPGYVQAHENVHLELASAYVRNLYSQLVGRINAISFPCTDQPDADSAKKAMDDAIFKAQRKFDNDFELAETNNKFHRPPVPFTHAQKEICRPLPEQITKRKAAINCK